MSSPINIYTDRQIYVYISFSVQQFAANLVEKKYVYNTTVITAMGFNFLLFLSLKESD